MRPLILVLAAALVSWSQNIPPQLEKPIIDTQKQIKAEVHQLGTWTLTAGPAGSTPSFQKTATATTGNTGKLTFDLAGSPLTTGWTVTLTSPPAVMPPLTDSVTVSAPTVVTDLVPSFNTTLVPTTKKVKATVHQFGTWTLTVHSANRDFTATQSASSDNKGVLTFDLTEEMNKAMVKELEISAVATLKPPTTLTAAQQTALTITTTVRRAEVSIRMNPVHEGDDVITGTITGTADRVRANVISPTGVATANTDEGAITSGKFSLGLPTRVPEGYTVRVVALQDGDEVGTFDYTSVIPVTYTWGRVRAYFSAGATIAAQDQDPKTETVNGVTKTTQERKFTEADYFVSLNVDYNWRTSLRDRPAVSCQRPAGLVEDLAQLEDLTFDWKPSRFTNLGDWGQIAHLQSAELDGINTALGTTAGRIQDAYGADCTNTEKLRAQQLRLLARSIKPHVDALEADAERFDDLFTQLKKLYDKVDTKTASPALLRFLQDVLSVSETVARLQPIQDDAAKPMLAIATELQTVAADIQAAIADASPDVASVSTAIHEFRRSDPGNPTGGYLVNTSFEGRVSQAPVLGQTPATSVTGGAASIVQSPNAGYVAADAYVPFWTRSMAWKDESRENAVFVAPIVRGGILAANSGPVPVPSDPNSPQLFRHVMPFISGGMRVGHLTFSGKRASVAPELISFLDVTYGRFDNFRLPKDTPANLLPTSNDRIPSRLEIYGRLRIPETPLYVGFTGNLGPGPDDMRFFFGTRFDFSKVVGKLLSRQP